MVLYAGAECLDLSGYVVDAVIWGGVRIIMIFKRIMVIRTAAPSRGRDKEKGRGHAQPVTRTNAISMASNNIDRNCIYCSHTCVWRTPCRLPVNGQEQLEALDSASVAAQRTMFTDRFGKLRSILNVERLQVIA